LVQIPKSEPEEKQEEPEPVENEEPEPAAEVVADLSSKSQTTQEDSSSPTTGKMIRSNSKNLTNNH
jgi:hypothetical protein